MKTCCLILVMLAWALKLSADPTNNPPPLKIGTGDATQFYGKEVTVTGQVAQVTIYENIIYLNLDKPYPAAFALMIYPRDSQKFGHLADLVGKDVEATGRIGGHPDWPDIVLEKTNQLKVLPSDATK